MVSVKDIKSVITSSDGLQQVLGILLVATILTIFEVVFFYIIVVPNVRTQLDAKLKDAGKKVAESLSEKTGKITKIIPGEFNKMIKDIIKKNEDAADDLLVKNNPLLHLVNTLRDRETDLRNRVNKYTKISGGLLILMLVLLIIYVVFAIRRESKIDKSTIISAIITVVLLIAFQYNFYLLGKKYKYTGTMGEEEFIKLIMDNLDN